MFEARAGPDADAANVLTDDTTVTELFQLIKTQPVVEISHILMYGFCRTKADTSATRTAIPVE